MKCYIYATDNSEFLGFIDRVPECGDYCEQCGECLTCYAEDVCTNGGDHHWIAYWHREDFEREYALASPTPPPSD